MATRAPFGPVTCAVPIRAAPPPGKLTMRNSPVASKSATVRRTASPIEVATGPIGVVAAAASGPGVAGILGGAADGLAERGGNRSDRRSGRGGQRSGDAGHHRGIESRVVRRIIADHDEGP